MQTAKPLIQITPVAKEKLAESLKEVDMASPLIRIGVAREGGGGCACCSEYSYSLSLKEKQDVEDIVEEVDGLKLAADRVDVEFIRGSVLDYVETPNASGFTIQNPNVQGGGCGCGGH
ncbi:MAG: iron-sulfur cluster assembly accessory protein [Nitrososphaerota archaeon]|nr:iron-sulfur cluster assembly accessory protein [Nitrososphaerota archaeon]